ncbi:MAG: GAP family protein [Mycobacterium sp.]|uniref:GAP family protein n=1 Tax=Mycobacterium sp. TaxID=1785 RepID=UPI003F981F2B
MWATVLILAGSVIFEPIRLGLVILLLNRRRPLLQLIAFLCGGFTMGVGVGLVVLFALRTAPVIGHLTVAEVQVGSGLIALLIAVVLSMTVTLQNVFTRAPAPVDGYGGVTLLERPPESGMQRLTERARGFLQGDSLYVAGIGGLGAALPSANYMGSMAAVLASHAAPVTQVQALLAFNLVAFTVAELPLVGYLAAPQKTRAFMAALHTWLRSRSRRDAAALVGVGGGFMLMLGLTSL